MLDILKTIVLSLVVIFIIHLFWNSFQETYSTKKTKDLVGSQTQKYKEILNEYIENSKNSTSLVVSNNTTTPSYYSSAPTFIDPQEKDVMNNELMQYLQSELSSQTLSQ